MSERKLIPVTLAELGRRAVELDSRAVYEAFDGVQTLSDASLPAGERTYYYVSETDESE